ncbi:M56 family metallopeptidase [Litorilituus sediminis]|uniref:Protein TonB n=1 Tax=Litorilituus sediminis TaxID=718192 RepID=A0A4P6PAJ6_9GAMM|nr:M56 family metallopeptidase [Litorilituus sediminis]QBG36655.1 TonB family protein [Litorilituus sediminis]
MLEQLFTNPYLYSLALTLLHFLWQGSLVALALKSLLVVIDKSKSQLRYALASLAMLANLVIASITFFVVFPSEKISTAAANSHLPLTTLVNELRQDSTLLNYQELLPSILAYSLPYIALLWLASVFILASKLVIEVHSVNRLPKNAKVLPSDDLLARFNELAKQINLTKAPKLLISLHVDVPMAIGWLKPVVLLPASMVTGLNSAQLEMLMLHELAHIRRHDYLVNFIQSIIELLFFFHPAVSWVAKQMRNEREYCSDDIAVKHCGDPIAYAHTLTDTASLCANRHQHTIPSMAMAASGGDLKQRVLRLVDHHCAPKNDTSKFLASITIVLTLFIIASQQLMQLPLSTQWENSLDWSSNNANFQHNTNQPVQSQQQHSADLANDSIALQLLSKPSEANKELESSNEQVTTKQASNKLTDSMEAEKLSSSVVSANKAPAVVPAKLELAPETSVPAKEITTSTLVNTNTQQQELAAKHNIITEDAVAVEQNKPAFIKQKASSTEKLIATSQAEIEPVLSAQNNDIEVSLNNKSTGFSNPYQAQLDELSRENTTYIASNLNNVVKDIYAPVKRNTVAAPVRLEAKPIKMEDPIYPSLAKRKGIEIEVKVNFTIDANGRVKNIQFASQNRVNYFKNAIRSAMRKWRFLPATVDSKAVESQMSKIFSFSLHG